MRRSYLIFLSIFSAIHFSLTGYVALRLAEQPWHWAVIGIFAALLWSLPIVHWRRSEEPSHSPVKEAFQIGSLLSMAILSWLLVLTIARDLALLSTYIVLERETRLLEFWNGTATIGAAFLLTLVGALRAFNGPHVKTVKISTGNSRIQDFRIVQITDLHVGPTIGRKYVQRVVDLVATLDPHVTVLTGDIIDGPFERHRASVEPFADLLPKGGVFYSPGNHEYYHRLDQWMPIFEEMGAKILLNRGESVKHGNGSVWVGGITDPAAAQMNLGEAPDVLKAFGSGADDSFRILLSHRPGFAEDASKAGFDLQLSGHTHGGQFFPWTYVARLFHRYLLGLFKHGDMWLYVGPGTGTWGPPARLGTTPEITLIHLS
ncbi:MAG: metallophosphoesterase [Bdellovibrionia bacterium]